MSLFKRERVVVVVVVLLVINTTGYGPGYLGDTLETHSYWVS